MIKKFSTKNWKRRTLDKFLRLKIGPVKDRERGSYLKLRLKLLTLTGSIERTVMIDF